MDGVRTGVTICGCLLANRGVIVQFQTHSVVDFVVLEGDVILVGDVPLLNANLLGARSYASSLYPFAHPSEPPPTSSNRR